MLECLFLLKKYNLADSDFLKKLKNVILRIINEKYFFKA